MARASGSDANTTALLRAGESLQAAFRYWNSVADWKWLRTTTDITTVIGTADYDLPPLLKNIHTILMEGSAPRALYYVDRRYFNKTLPQQTIPGVPGVYDLFNAEHGPSGGSGKLKLFPIPSVSETARVDYFRRMVLPCAVTTTGILTEDIAVMNGIADIDGITIGSVMTGANLDLGTTVVSIDDGDSVTFTPAAISSDATADVVFGGDTRLLDCPEDYVEGICAWATHHYLINKAGSPRLEYWQQYAQAELDRALRQNMSDTPDEEICFLPKDAYAPNYMSPNDLRWSDLSW